MGGRGRTRGKRLEKVKTGLSIDGRPRGAAILAGIDHGSALLNGLGCLILLLLLLTAPVSAAGSGDYQGVKKCNECHDAVGARWAATRHGNAFESLKKSGQETLPKCIACHVTGYEKPGGFIDHELTPELAGVQCEECHGPGGKHVDAPGKENVVTRPGQETCRRCHTPGQDPQFDYTKKIRNIH
jgi:hypothetical protein